MESKRKDSTMCSNPLLYWSRTYYCVDTSRDCETRVNRRHFASAYRNRNSYCKNVLKKEIANFLHWLPFRPPVCQEILLLCFVVLIDGPTSGHSKKRRSKTVPFLHNGGLFLCKLRKWTLHVKISICYLTMFSERLFELTLYLFFNIAYRIR